MSVRQPPRVAIRLAVDQRTILGELESFCCAAFNAGADELAPIGQVLDNRTGKVTALFIDCPTMDEPGIITPLSEPMADRRDHVAEALRAVSEARGTVGVVVDQLDECIDNVSLDLPDTSHLRGAMAILLDACNQLVKALIWRQQMASPWPWHDPSEPLPVSHPEAVETVQEPPSEPDPAILPERRDAFEARIKKTAARLQATEGRA